MDNKKSTVKTAVSASSSNGTEKKVWRQPQLTQLNIKETKGGFFHIHYEDQYNIFLHS